MRLELGAGYRPTEGFIHNDAKQWSHGHIEIVWPAECITAHPDVGEESCDELRATHLLEHFSYKDTPLILREWWRALKPGGLLYLEVPNFGWQARAYAAGEIDCQTAINYVMGEQDYEGNFHYAGFDQEYLTNLLVETGFDQVRVQDIGQVLCAWGTK